MNKINRIRNLLLIIPMILFMSSCVSNQKYTSAQNELDRLKRDSLLLANTVESKDQRLMAMMEQNEKVEMELMSTKTALDKKERLLAESEAEAERMQARLEIIAKDLDVFNTQFSSVSVVDGQVKLVMNESILFAQGSNRINNQGDILLERLAATLKKSSNIQVAIAGHTDPTPVKGADDNWDLSVDRSIAVISKLTEEYGVSPDKLMAAGKSKFDPIASNDTPESMAKNRRVEFLILPNLQSLKTELNK